MCGLKRPGSNVPGSNVPGSNVPGSIVLVPIFRILLLIGYLLFIGHFFSFGISQKNEFLVRLITRREVPISFSASSIFSTNQGDED